MHNIFILYADVQPAHFKLRHFPDLVAPAQGMTRTNRATNQTWLKKIRP